MKKVLAILAVLAWSSGARAVEAGGTFSGTSSQLVIPVGGMNGVSFSIGPGIKATISLQTSYDGGATYYDEASSGPVYINTTSTSYAGSYPLGAGATHARTLTTTYVTGSAPAALRATVTAGPARATVSGTLAASGEYIAIPVDPTRWGTMGLTVIGSGGLNLGTLLEYSGDGGTNWLASPYTTRTDAVSANPATTSITTGGGGLTYTYSIPIPGYATHARNRVFTYIAGNQQAYLSLGKPYTPGNPTVATLTDVSSTFNGVLDVSLDTSGWKEISYFFTTPTTSGMGYYAWQLDDTGATSTIYTASTATQTIYGALGSGTTLNTAGGNVTTTSGASMPRRLLLRSTAIAGYQTRIRVEGRR
jgi:hypothetical protein